MICVKEITQKVSNHPGRPSYDALHIPFLVSAGQVTLTLKEETYILIKDGGVRYVALITEDETFAPADKLDVGSSLEPGKDYYVYATTAGTIVVSRNSTYPAGYSAANSRKVGGFHTLCCATGTITGRPTNNLATGAIIPNSVWCLNFKPKNGRPEGMAYLDLTHTYLGASFPNLPKLPLWVDIYMQSGSGATTASAYGGTITDARVWDDHSDDMAAVMKRLPGDAEFSVGATGSNALTNIYGSQDPVTAGNCASGLFAGAGLNDLTVSRAAYVPPAGSANEARNTK